MVGKYVPPHLRNGSSSATEDRNAQVERVERVERVEPGPENLFVRTESSPRCALTKQVVLPHLTYTSSTPLGGAGSFKRQRTTLADWTWHQGAIAGCSGRGAIAGRSRGYPSKEDGFDSKGDGKGEKGDKKSDEKSTVFQMQGAGGDWSLRFGNKRKETHTEEEVFGPAKTRSTSGIDFDKYDAIPVQVTGENCEDVKPIVRFSEAKLVDSLFDNLRRCGYDRPTPVQKYSIPIVLSGR
eukprot:symbB.v1.2.028866.t2/scaffold3026.1/size65065/1